MSDFALHDRLEADTLAVLDLPLCRVRLMRDANYAWLVLIPRRAEMEIVDLAAEDQQQLMIEIAKTSAVLRAAVPCDKLNVAALGNVVAQLHVHVIARRHDDPAWPRPVWGAVPATAYGAGEAEALAQRLAAAFRA